MITVSLPPDGPPTSVFLNGGTDSLHAQIERAKLYLRNGYPSVPILSPDAPAFILVNGQEKEQSPGKQPYGALWSVKDRQVYQASESSIDAWRRMRNIREYPGLGIACGTVVALDGDIYELAVAVAVEELIVAELGRSKLRRVGLPPKFLDVYRAAGEPIATSYTPKFFKDGLEAQLEIIGQGRQFVSDGIHPETREPYRWGAATPANTPLRELALITPQQIERLKARIERLLRDAGYRTKTEIEAATRTAPTPKAMPEAKHLSPFRAINDAALARTEAWVPDLFPAAKRSANGAWRVRSRDLGRDLEEDISISADGIVDFGVHDMGDAREGRRTPIDLVIEHGGAADAKQAAMWLADRLGVTLNFSSRQGGVEPSRGEGESGKEEKPGAETGANQGDDQPSPKPLPSGLPPVAPLDPALLPEALRGWVEDVSDRMQCPPDYPAVATVVALSAVIGRQIAIRPKRFDEWTVVPNLWGGVIGSPGELKTPAVQDALKPLSASKLRLRRNTKRG
jgi:hypothetical protein